MELRHKQQMRVYNLTNKATDSEISISIYDVVFFKTLYFF